MKTDDEYIEEFKEISQAKVDEGVIDGLPYADYAGYWSEEQIDWLRTTIKAVRESKTNNI